MLNRFFGIRTNSITNINKINDVIDNEPQPLSLNELYEAAEKINSNLLTFQARLAAAEYHDVGPFYFMDPIDFILMDTPIMINNNSEHTIDKRTLLALKTAVNPFTNLGISSIAINHERATKIETFVRLIEKIHNLKQQLANIIANQQKAIAISNATQYSLVRIQHQYETYHAKIELRETYKQFIEFSKSIINNSDIEQREKDEEINNIVKKSEEELTNINNEIEWLRYNNKILLVFCAELKKLQHVEASISAIEDNLADMKKAMYNCNNGLCGQSDMAVKILNEQIKELLAAKDIPPALHKFITTINHEIEIHGEHETLLEEMRLVLASKEADLAKREQYKSSTAEYYYNLEKFLQSLNELNKRETEIKEQEYNYKTCLASLSEEGHSKQEIALFRQDNHVELQCKKYELYLAFQQFTNDYNKEMQTNNVNQHEITYIILNIQKKTSALGNELVDLVKPNPFMKNPLDSMDQIKIAFSHHIPGARNGIASIVPFNRINNSNELMRGISFFTSPLHRRTQSQQLIDNHDSHPPALPRPGGRYDVD